MLDSQEQGNCQHNNCFTISKKTVHDFLLWKKSVVNPFQCTQNSVWVLDSLFLQTTTIIVVQRFAFHCCTVSNSEQK